MLDFLRPRRTAVRPLPPQNPPETDWYAGLSDRTQRSVTTVEGGIPPSRIPRFWPTRERVGVLYQNAPHAMGVPYTADMAFLPPPLLGTVKGATSRSMRYPQKQPTANATTIPAIYVGQQQ